VQGLAQFTQYLRAAQKNVAAANSRLGADVEIHVVMFDCEIFDWHSTDAAAIAGVLIGHRGLRWSSMRKK
jgi:hypothetical protein